MDDGREDEGTRDEGMMMTGTQKTKLVLGSAGRAEEKAVTLDINPLHNPDVLHDLNNTPLPFDDNAFKEIICHHVLEHLNDLKPVMDELHRICRPEGEIYIEVPHHTSWCANTPEHRLRFNYFAFESYIEKGRTDWMKTEKKFTILKRELTFHRSLRRVLLHRLFNRFPETYERFWAYIFPAEHVKIWLRPIK